MGRKGPPLGLKRKPAPRFWPIHRKEFIWVVKPSTGPHSLEKCIPLVLLLRDVLGFAKTRKEAKVIVSKGKVYVDGRVRREDNYPVGLMDVISIPEMKRFFRIIPSRKGLILNTISEQESEFKLCRIENKTMIKKGKIQLNLHDGSNVLLKPTDPETPEKETYKLLDTVKINLPEREILDRIRMEEKHYATIIGGKNIGKHGIIVEIQETMGRKSRKALVTIEDDRGNRYQTILNLVFTVGEEKPLISLPEAENLV